MRQGLYARSDATVVWVTAISMRIQTRVQGRATWRTHSRGGKCQLEPQTFGSEPVNAGRAYDIIAIAAHLANALVVSNKQDDVGFVLIRLARKLICSAGAARNS